MAAAKKSIKSAVKKPAKKASGKLTKKTKKVVAKHSKTAKKGIKKLVKKAVAKSSKLTKKAIHKNIASSGKRKKAKARIKSETKSMMQPFSDIAVAVIDAVDNAMHSVMTTTAKTRKK